MNPKTIKNASKNEGEQLSKNCHATGVKMAPIMEESNAQKQCMQKKKHVKKYKHISFFIKKM